MQIYIYILSGIILVLSIIIGIIYFRFITIKKDLRNIKKQSNYIKEHTTNLIINGYSTDEDVNDIINDYNTTILSINSLKHKMIHEEKEIRNIITNLSHDLRTPITSMLGFTQLLEKEELTDKQKEYVSVISDRAKTVKALVEQLFSYSLVMELEALELKDENISSLLEDSILMYYDEFEAINMQLNLVLEEHPVVCKVDKMALKRVFMNIISNALKYGESEMMIEQNNHCITFKNKTNLIDTIDTNRIFDRFFSVAKNRVNGSMGLGLTIAKELVEKMDGHIQATKQEEYLIITIKLKAVGL